MNLCQMNILAPLWLSKMYASLPCYDQYADRMRLDKTLAYLRVFDSDIYCLSEVQEQDLPTIRRLFDSWFVVYSSHECGFWKEWLEGKEWISNGTCIMIRKSQLTLLDPRSIDLGNGCTASHAMVVRVGTGLRISIISLHLDTSEGVRNEHRVEERLEGTRLQEQLDRLVHYLQSIDYDVSIISGDWNTTDVSRFTSLGYVETASGLQSTPIPQGRIDHTLVLGAIDVEGQVHSLGDACSTVHVNGSDHYATTSTIWC